MNAYAHQLTRGVLDGDRRAIAMAITVVEAEGSSAAALIKGIYHRSGRAYLVGVTGAPGVGKSTLVDRIMTVLRSRGRTVGVLAVDPTSPFSGGAILGDRVRMQTHALDPGVFVRSMATRGQLGGLSRATADAAVILDAGGFDVIVIETVGVGQAEIEISRTADMSVVVAMPGSGDGVQALKAGVMEIADLFVVNKADHNGADRAVSEIKTMLGLNEYGPDDWQPPVLQTCATDGIGVDDVVDTVDRFRARADGVAGRRRQARVCGRIRQLASDGFLEHAEHRVLEPGAFDQLVDQVAGAEMDPYTAAEAVMDQALRSPRGANRTDDAEPLTGVLEHIGIAVRDLDTALVFYRDALGLELEGVVEEVASQHVRAQFVSAGPATLELLEATSPQSPIARSIERRGPGLHHLTLRVDDIVAVLARLKARGVRLIDEEPRMGAGGRLVAFIHPSAAHGVLVELLESPALADSTGRGA
jgi:LAO/AO transport system kinase